MNAALNKAVVESGETYSRRAGLRAAAVVVRVTTPLGRRGPAEGFILDHSLKSNELRERHVTATRRWDTSHLASLSSRSDALRPEVSPVPPLLAKATSAPSTFSVLSDTPDHSPRFSTTLAPAPEEPAAAETFVEPSGETSYATAAEPSVQSTGEASADSAHAIPDGELARSLTMRLAAMICGTWRCVRTDAMEPYLKHLGVGWAKRRIAIAFKPETSWALVDGTVQCLMATPIGEPRIAPAACPPPIASRLPGRPRGAVDPLSTWRQASVSSVSRSTGALASPIPTAVTSPWVTRSTTTGAPPGPLPCTRPTVGSGRVV